MRQHFVTFYSPGTFVAEETTRPIAAWDVEAAQAMSSSVSERHGARPYGFRFTTRERGEADLDSHVTAKSPMYFLPHCVVRTVADLDPQRDSILISNMEGNGWPRVVQTTEGWSWTVPLAEKDVVLSPAEAVNP